MTEPGVSAVQPKPRNERPQCDSTYLGVQCEWGAGHPPGTDAGGHYADHGAPSRGSWWVSIPPSGAVQPKPDDEQAKVEELRRLLDAVNDEHFPWQYTEYGVLCACGSPMRDEQCIDLLSDTGTAFKAAALAALPWILDVLGEAHTEAARLRTENEHFRAEAVAAWSFVGELQGDGDETMASRLAVTLSAAAAEARSLVAASFLPHPQQTEETNQ